MFQINRVLALDGFVGRVVVSAIVEDVAVLIDLDERRPFVGGGALQHIFQVLHIHDQIDRAANVASAPIAMLMGRIGYSGAPIGVLLVFFPCSLVGEYCPLVNP